MILIGELLNSTRGPIRRAMADRDEKNIQELAKKQESAGAGYLDVNAGAFAEKELEFLEWLIRTVREVTPLPLCIDSPKPEALALGASLAQGDLMLNSLTAEEDKIQSVLPLVKEFNAKVIALPMDQSGLSDDEEKIFSIACHLIERLVKEGIEPDRIFLDPLIRPISTNSSCGQIVLNLLLRIRKEFPDVHRVCGLSNISFGLPKRKLLNRVFLTMSMACGLDAAIVDPLDRELMAELRAAEALVGNDPFCMNYIQLARSGALDDKD